MEDFAALLAKITAAPQQRAEGWFFNTQKEVLDADAALARAHTEEVKYCADAKLRFQENEAKKEYARLNAEKAKAEARAAETKAIKECEAMEREARAIEYKATKEYEAKEREARAMEIKAMKEYEASLAAAEADKFKAQKDLESKKAKADGRVKVAVIESDKAQKCEEIKKEATVKVAAIAATERVRIAELQTLLFDCPVPGCGFTCRDNEKLKQHFAQSHSGGGGLPQIQYGYGNYGKLAIGRQPDDQYGFGQLSITGPPGNNEHQALALQRRGHY